MAGRYNQWLRAKLAARIESNGGYYARRECPPLEWCVYFVGSIDGVESAKRALVECDHFVNEADLTLQFPDFEEWYEEEVGDGQAMYESAQELLQENLSNDEGLLMWSPKTALRYGFDYKGEGADRPFDMALCGYGRGGKHVCLTRFDCHKIGGMSNSELVEAVANHVGEEQRNVNYDWIPSNQWCRKLMGITDELDEALTSENAERCGRYYQTDWLARELGIYD